MNEFSKPGRPGPPRPFRRWSAWILWFMLAFCGLVSLGNLISLGGVLEEGDWPVVPIRLVFATFFALGVGACADELRRRRSAPRHGEETP